MSPTIKVASSFAATILLQECGKVLPDSHPPNEFCRKSCQYINDNEIELWMSAPLRRSSMAFRPIHMNFGAPQKTEVQAFVKDGETALDPEKEAA
jgi:hypothetical protein